MLDCDRDDCLWPECQCADITAPPNGPAFRAFATIFAVAAIAAAFVALALLYG